MYSNKKLQIFQLSDSISTLLRKKKANVQINAQNLLEPGFIDQVISNDQGYSILRNIRGSPPYWEVKKKELVCMLMQLGVPTFFLTLSAAETKWPELLVLLNKIVKAVDISLEEAEKLSFNEKAELIRKEPVICAKYFEHRLNSLFDGVLRKPNGPFKQYEIIDFYYRVEFQHRG